VIRWRGRSLQQAISFASNQLRLARRGLGARGQISA